jgi:phosphoribosylaminoimidazole-succinocarboxamide synthase
MSLPRDCAVKPAIIDNPPVPLYFRTMNPAVLATDLPFPKRSGKVRDVYDVSDVIGKAALLIVATDRISAFDCIMPNGIPDKGKVLTQISSFWFDRFTGKVDHHVITTLVDELPSSLRAFATQIEGRFVLGKKTHVVPIECVARGYLAGSGWKEYQASRSVCGINLPEGLRQCDRLPSPIFTPATKAETGHDENISFEIAARETGAELAATLRDLTLHLYGEAAEYAASRGIIIADTKFEFGLDDAGKLILIDEILTPDSSRFWPADQYAPGKDQPSYDKQFVRNWLETQTWNKTPPAPALPAEVVAGTRQRYIEAYEKLTGLRWDN